MKLVAYVRVSTIGQVREGYGLDAERADIRAWAKANHHRIMLWCSDEGVSGANGVEADKASTKRSKPSKTTESTASCSRPWIASLGR